MLKTLNLSDAAIKKLNTLAAGQRSKWVSELIERSDTPEDFEQRLLRKVREMIGAGQLVVARPAAPATPSEVGANAEQDADAALDALFNP